MRAKSLGYTAVDIAKWFINSTDRESGDDITHLKVQKLVYYAQGWAIALLKKPLFAEDLQAWAHGPVAVSVWDQFKDLRWESLPPQKITRKIANEPALLLDAVNDRYGIFSAKRLERMTHAESPWKNARKGLPPEARSTAIISKEDIEAHFTGLIKKSGKAVGSV
jgi:uncharacterized phage-associated protein